MTSPDLTSYLAPRCSGSTLDLFVIRRGILRGLTESLPRFHGRVLDVGCGYQPYRQLIESPPSRATTYVGVDLAEGLYATKPDATWDGTTLPFDTGHFDSALATEVLEHCPNPQGTLNEIARILKPGGFLFFTVPFMWPLHDMPYDEYRYTPTALTRHLSAAGFSAIDIKPTGGWDASLAQMIALWVRNRPMRTWRKRLLTAIATPAVRFLASRDRPPAFMDQYVMIPGFTGTAVKN